MTIETQLKIDYFTSSSRANQSKISMQYEAVLSNVTACNPQTIQSFVTFLIAVVTFFPQNKKFSICSEIEKLTTKTKISHTQVACTQHTLLKDIV